MTPLKYGVFVPQGWKLEYQGWEAAAAWARSVEIAQLAESLGYEHLWVYDHVETVPRREPTHMFEAFTMLSALSQRTERIRLGEMVTCVAYRNVGLLAKEVACLDVYSGGRAILGLGAGWYEREYQAYGYEYPGAGDRLGTLDEALQSIKGLWTEETFTFRGEHVAFDGAYCDPKPIQSLPEVWVGGGGEKVTLRIAARHADRTNWQVGLDAFVHKSGLLARYCEEIGRDPQAIVRTHAPDLRLFDSEADLARWLEHTPEAGSDGGGHLWGRTDPAEYVRDNFVGTVDQVVEKVQAFVDAGAREFVLWARDYPGTESIERFAREVIPQVQG